MTQSTPPYTEVGSLAHDLQTYGGWGVAALLAIALIFLIRYVVKNDGKHANLAIELVKESTRASVETTHAVNNSTKALETLSHRLETLERLLRG